MSPHCLSRFLAVLCLFVIAFTVRALEFKSVRASGYSRAISLEFEVDKGGSLLPVKPSELTITPQVDNLNVSCNWQYLSITGNFKANQLYKVTLPASIRDSKGGCLGKPLTVSAVMPSLVPNATFLANGFIFPLKRENFSLPITLTNVKAIRANLYQIYQDNLVPFDVRNTYRLDEISSFVTSKVFTPKIQQDEPTKAHFMLESLIPRGKCGVYYITIDRGTIDEDGEYTMQDYDYSNPRVVLITDMTLAAAVDPSGKKAAVSVRRLSDNAPMPDAEITVYSRNNVVLGKGKSADDGTVTIPFAPNFKPDDQDVKIITARKGDDFTVLAFTTHWNDKNKERNVGTLPRKEDMRDFVETPQAFAFTERGAVRPGEAFSAFAYIRQNTPEGLRPIPDFPCTMTLVAPDGSKIKSVKCKSDKYGFISQQFDIDGVAPTGPYYVTVSSADKTVVGSTYVLVSTFMPDLIKASIATDAKYVTPSTPLVVTPKAKYYFGEPVTRCDSSLYVTAEQAKFKSDDFTFGDDADFVPGEIWKEERRDSQLASFTYPGWKPNGTFFVPVKLQVHFSVSEVGGRAVTAGGHVYCKGPDYFLGLKHIDNATFATKADVPRGYPKGPVPETVTLNIHVNKISYNYNYVTKNGRRYYEWEQIITPAKEYTVDKFALGDNLTVKDLPYGHYELVVSIGKDIRTRTTFWNEAGETGQRLPDPRSIVFKTDKETYAPGETATLSFESDYDGYAFFAHGEHGIDGSGTFDVKKGPNTFTLTVGKKTQTEHYACNIFVTSAKPGEQQFGFISLKVKQDNHKLSLKLTHPVNARPNEQINVTIQATDFQGKATGAHVQMYLVDEGILALTDYKCPDIFAFFYGPKYNPMMLANTIDWIYPDDPIAYALKIGGDASIMKAIAGKSLNIKQKKPAIVVLPPQVIPESGTLTVPVTIPDHQGALRVVAVASAGTAVGSTESDMTVRGTVGISATVPRVVAINDDFIMTVSLRNFEETETNAVLTVSMPEGIKVQEGTTITRTLPKGAAEIVQLHCHATDKLDSLEIPCKLVIGKSERKDSVFLTVRSANPPTTLAAHIVVEPGETKTLSAETLGTDFMGQDIQTTLALAQTPSTALLDSLAWLNNYPYGCLEQTISCATPFLYLDQMVKAGALTKDDAEHYRWKVGKAIQRIQSMHRGNGGFSLWPGENTAYEDLTLTVAQFLVAAENAHPGTAPREITQKVIDRLINQSYDSENLREQAEICVAISRWPYLSDSQKRAVASFSERILDADSVIDYTDFLASAALCYVGYPARGAARLKKALDKQVWLTVDCDLQANRAQLLGSTLVIAMDLAPKHKANTTLVQSLMALLREDGTGWGTTQSNAWATIGIAAYCAYYADPTINASLTINGKDTEMVTAQHTWKWNNVPTLTIKNNGKMPLYLIMRTSGIPAQMPQITTPGLFFTRTVTDLNDNEVDLNNVARNSLLKVTLTFNVKKSFLSPAIVDMLPGCFEIEDDTLATRARINYEKINSEIKKGPKQLPTIFVDKRDDRVMVFAHTIPTGVWEFSYLVRVTGEGTFTNPPVILESMFDPDVKANFVPEKATISVK